MDQAVTKLIFTIVDMMIQKTEILVVKLSAPALFPLGELNDHHKITATVTNSASHLRTCGKCIHY